jgi:RHS repeat-associated protein
MTTHHERDVETGLDYRGARFYDSDVARFLSLDPLAAQFPEWSAYNYVLGNPVMFVDPDGKAPQDDYIFNECGDFVRIDKKPGMHKLVIENSATCNKKTYDFADPLMDSKAIEEGTITKVLVVDEGVITKMLGDAGVFENKNKTWSYFYKESKGGGKLDFSYSIIPSEFATDGVSQDPLTTPSPMLFIPKGSGVAHNHMNFGNFLWGAAGTSLGFDEITLRLGAHYNSYYNSKTNGYEPQLDSYDDQFSIREGINYANNNGFGE